MTPLELMVLLQRIKMDALLQSVLVIVRMVSKPPEGSSLVMKSIVIVSNGLVFSAGVIG
jgi:hypothetical protein